MSDHSIIELRSCDFSLGLQPGFGGSIAYWRWHNQDLFRPTSRIAMSQKNILDTASFPLVPFSNRIDQGHFVWGGQDIQLPANHSVSKHSIHGLGWQASWQARIIQNAYAEIILQHDADSRWPWSFRAVQHFTMNGESLIWEMTLENTSDTAMPAGLGFHPHFPKNVTQLQFTATSIWNNQDMLPSARTPVAGHKDFSKSHDVDDAAGIDNCFEGWSGLADITWPEMGYKIMLSANCNAAMLFVPEDRDYFSFEPVNHVNNAVNMQDHGIIMPSLAPGEHNILSVTMKYSSI